MQLAVSLTMQGTDFDHDDKCQRCLGSYYMNRGSPGRRTPPCQLACTSRTLAARSSPAQPRQVAQTADMPDPGHASSHLRRRQQYCRQLQQVASQPAAALLQTKLQQVGPVSHAWGQVAARPSHCWPWHQSAEPSVLRWPCLLRVLPCSTTVCSTPCPPRHQTPSPMLRPCAGVELRWGLVGNEKRTPAQES